MNKLPWKPWHEVVEPCLHNLAGGDGRRRRTGAGPPGRCDLRMVVDLQRHNPSELPGRVGNDVGKVAVQRQQNGPEFLSLGNYREVRRFLGDRVLEPQHFMFRGTQSAHNLI